MAVSEIVSSKQHLHTLGYTVVVVVVVVVVSIKQASTESGRRENVTFLTRGEDPHHFELAGRSYHCATRRLII